MTPDVQSALQTVLHRGILPAMEVGFGSFATPPGKQQVQPCPLCPDSDLRPSGARISRSATTGRKQVQQILEANSSNVMRNNRPLWLVDSSKTLYVAHRGKSLSLPGKLSIKRERAEVLALIN